MFLNPRGSTAVLALAAVVAALPADAQKVKFMADLQPAESVDGQGISMADVIVTYRGDDSHLDDGCRRPDRRGRRCPTPRPRHARGDRAPVIDMTVDGTDETEEPVAQNILDVRADLADEQFADLQAGLYYINVHIAEYPDGEIRGQVLEGEADMSGMGSVAASDALAKDDAAASTDTASEGVATSEDGVANGTDTVPEGDATIDSEVASKGEAATEEAPCGPRPQRPEPARPGPAPRPTPWNGVVRAPRVGVVRDVPN